MTRTTITGNYSSRGTVGSKVVAGLGVMSAAMTMLLARAALAEDVTDGSDTLQEIVVTANKREESIQKVPISMSAMTGEQLADLHADNLNDLGQYVPGLQLRNEFSIATPMAFIRGIGNSSFVTTSVMPVGFYTDGVYIGENIAQGLQLFDVDRVEVLRGPQGTLFGRNTTGGLIDVITRKPSLEADTNGDLTVTGGQYDTFDVDAALGGKLDDTMAYRLAFSRQSDGGEFYDVNPSFTGDRHVGDTDSYAARAQLLWKPVESLSALFNVHWGQSDSGLVINKAGFYPNATGSNCPQGAVPGKLYNGCTDPFGYGLTTAAGWFDTMEATRGRETINSYGTSAQLDWIVGDYTLTSLSAWDKANMVRLHDSNGTALSLLTSSFFANTSYWSQELRATSKYEGPLNWIGGLNYYGDENASFTHYGAGDLGGTGIAQILGQRTQSYAIFGEANLKFAQRWTFTLGARETSDERKANIQTWATNAYGVVHGPDVSPALVPAVSATGLVTEAMARAAYLAPLIPYTALDKTWKKWSGRASLSYALDENKMLYISAAHGFKGGEFNGAAIISPSEVTLTDPEYLDNYEVGLKSTWFENRLRANLAGFFMRYKDQQVVTYLTADAVFPALHNAGASQIKGVEFEFEARPGRGLILGISGSYLDAYFTQFYDPVSGDSSGNRLASSPRWSVNGLARYEHRLAGGQLAIQIEDKYVTSQYPSPQNQVGMLFPGYALADIRASYTLRGGSTEIGVFAKNAFDRHYILSAYDLNSFGMNVFQVGRPRMVGADLSYRF